MLFVVCSVLLVVGCSLCVFRCVSLLCVVACCALVFGDSCCLLFVVCCVLSDVCVQRFVSCS